MDGPEKTHLVLRHPPPMRVALFWGQGVGREEYHHRFSLYMTKLIPDGSCGLQSQM